MAKNQEKTLSERVQEIIAQTIGCSTEDVTPDANLVDDLGADSLDVVEVVMELEEQFNIEIPDEDTEGITTVQQVVDYIEKHVRK